MGRGQRGHIAPEHLADFCRERLEPAVAARVVAHLGECEECEQARVRIEAGLAAMGQIAEEDAPDLAWDHIGAQIYWKTSSERRARERGRDRVRRPWGYGLAFACVLVGGIAWMLEARDSSTTTMVIEEASPARSVDLARAPEAAIGAATPLVAAVVFAQGAVFADGQTLDPNAPIAPGSRLSTGEGQLVIQFGASSAFRVAPNSTLAVDALDSKRIALRIDGQVDVDITRRHPGQEFSVKAGNHEVQVRGTAFRVEFAGDDLGVQCIRGKVVVTDGDHGVDVSAGQRFQVLRDALGDAALRAIPMDREALEELGRAMRMPMLAVWDEASLVSSTALLQVDGAAGAAVAVDGDIVGEGSFIVRTSVGEHDVALVDSDGELEHSRRLRAASGSVVRTHIEPSAPPAQSGRALRKGQLRAALVDSPRVQQCLAPLSKQRLLSGSYLVLDVGVNPDGSQSYLNLLDSNLSPAIQTCLRDVVDAQALPPGPAASFRFRLSY